MPQVVDHRYILGTALGQGGMGRVYKALDRLTGDTVALKQMTTAPSALEFASKQGDSTDLRFALAQEFKTLASLHHPHIISVLDYGFESHQPYFTMTMVENARTLLEAGASQPLSVKLNLVIQLLQALAYLHRRGVLHRDLKPANVLVTADDQVKMLDFGLALTVEQTRQDEIAGTLKYMTPEILQGKPYTMSADLYAVGVMMFELLAGRYPFPTDGMSLLINAILREEPNWSALYAGLNAMGAGDGISDALLLVMKRLMAKTPDARFDSAAAVIAELCRAAGMPVPSESIAIRESFLQAARFVGREQELSLLQAALQASRDGTGSTWLIGGESGVGKSRLLSELRTLALVKGVPVLRGQMVADGGLPYQLWRDPLRRLVLTTPLSDDEAAILKALIPDIGALMTADADAPRLIPDAPPLSGAAAQQRLAQTVQDVFRRQTTPLVLLLEDLHWASESLALLKPLVAIAGELPLLLVGSYRDDERPGLPDELPGAQTLMLKRLAAPQIAALSASMLGEVGQQPHVLDLLERETEGNAFFLVEVVRTLAEEAGRLDQIGQRTLPRAVFAGGVQQVVLRRLNRVPPNLRRLLNLAAVIGREPDLDVLRAAAPDAPPDWLLVCAEHAVLEISEGRWRFTHDKLREGLLADLTPDEARALNRQSAEAIERVYAESLNDHAAQLAQHWAAAGDVVNERRYTRMAADQFEAHCAYRDALVWYKRALALEGKPTTDQAKRASAELVFKLGMVCYSLSQYEDALRWADECLAVYRAVDDAAGIADTINLRGEALMRQGKLDEAVVVLQEALERRLTLGNRRQIGYSYMNLSVVHFQRGEAEKALALCRECYEHMQAGGDARDIARALNNLGNYHDVLGDLERAEELHREALAIRQRIDDRLGLAYSHTNLGFVMLGKEDYDEARRMFRESQRLSRLVGNQISTAASLGALGDVEYELEQYADAEPHYQQSLALRRTIGDRVGIAQTLLHLGDVAAETGRLDEAWALYQEALSLYQTMNAPRNIDGVIASAAVLLAKAGQARDAGVLFAYRAAQPGEMHKRAQKVYQDLQAALSPADAAETMRGSTMTQAEALDFAAARWQPRTSRRPISQFPL